MSRWPVPVDAAARARIVTELDRNLLVEAGAGSGKTHEMAARMAAGVAAGIYRVEQIAAVTFTRKAAAELRGRFQLALEQQLAQESSADAIGRIRQALANLERFFAGTIHAFCARLLRERPVEAGVAPGFTELDDVEEGLLRELSWRDYRAQAKAAGDPDLLAVLDAGISARQLDDAFETVCLYEDVAFPAGHVEMPDGDATWRALEGFWRRMSELLPAVIDPRSTCKTQQRAERFRRAWTFACQQTPTNVRLVDLLSIWNGAPGVVQMYWGTRALAKAAESLHAEFRDAVILPFLTSWRQYLYRRCVVLLLKARDAARAERRRRNTLSFNDLLILTADVLRTNGDVRRSLQNKYRWLFVDEFQDTDPLQAEIMFLLASQPGSEARDERSELDWRAVTLRPGALFVVGDPKQSIYRFRRADIDIYNDVRARLGGADGRGIVSLTSNFRSVPGLCAWANQVFAERFPAAPTAHAPKFAPLDAVRPSIATPELVVLDIPGGIGASDVATEEASRIARYIRAEVDAGRRQFGDFLILTRKKRALQPYAAALEALQIPIEVTGAGAFGESDEVRHLALLLAALTDPQDVVSLVGVLRGPFFGLSDRELFAHRHAGGWFSIWAGESAAAPPSAAAQALAQLQQWHRWTRLLPAGAALERILDDSGYLALASTSPASVEAGDLLHAIDRVRGIVEGGFTLADAAAALATWCGLDEEPRDSNEVDSLPLEPGRRDVVRLMNLHKAKGLEADIVFLADPLGGFEPRVDVRIVRSGGAALGFFEITEAGKGKFAPRVLAQPEEWDRYCTEERAYLDAEVDRLLYVAATRARDQIVVGRWPGRPGARTLAWGPFIPSLAHAPVLNIPEAPSASVEAADDLSTEAAAAGAAAAAAAHDRARLASWSAPSVTAETKRFPRVSPTSDDGAPDDPTGVMASESSSRRADAGLAWGTLVHGLLEHAMRHASATRDDLRRLALWLTMEEPQLRVLIDRALDTVDTVKAAGFWSDARASAERHEEAPFSRLQPDADVPNVLSGTIDLVYRDGDEWRIVDYKTDADGADADLSVRHRAQLAAYEGAWGAVALAPVQARIVGAR